MVVCMRMFAIGSIPGRLVFTVPSHSPARLFRVSNETCASDFGAAVLAASVFCASGCAEDALPCLCTSDCVKARVGRDIRTMESKKRTDFICILLMAEVSLVLVVDNQNRACTSFFLLLYITITVRHMSSILLNDPGTTPLL